MVRALIDYENNAEEFWETLQATLPEIWNKFVDSDTVELSCEEWSAVQNVPGFSTGPAYAQAALLVEQESSSTISGGPHTEGIQRGNIHALEFETGLDEAIRSVVNGESP